MERRKTRVFKAGSSVEGVFGNDKHTAWHSFTESFANGQYDKILKKSLYPKRKDFASTSNELQSWEEAV